MERNSDRVPLEVGMSLAEANRRIILATLESCAWNKRQAARLLGITVKTLYNRLREYGIVLPSS
jgi:DNA-binding NtrC family response regulator